MLEPHEIGVTMNMSLFGVQTLRDIVTRVIDIKAGKEVDWTDVPGDDLENFVDLLDQLISDGEDFALTTPDPDDEPILDA